MFKENEKKDRERKRKHRDNLAWEKKSKSSGLSDIFFENNAADSTSEEKRSTTESTKIPKDLATFRTIAETALKRQQNFRFFPGSNH